MEKLKNNNGIFYVIISLLVVLGIGYGVVQAYSNSQTVNVSGGVYNYNEAPQAGVPEVSGDVVSEEPVLGAGVADDYTDRIYWGNVQLKRADSNIDVELFLTPSTTATTLKGVAAQYRNDSNDDLICFGETLYVDFYDALGGFGSNFWVGTTTRKDGFYLTATTSAQLIGSTRVSTTTQGILTTQMTNDHARELIGADALGSYFAAIKDGTMGSATGTQPFLLRDGEVLVVGYDYAGATSTDSWTNGEAATDTKPARLHVNCINRRGNN